MLITTMMMITMRSKNKKKRVTKLAESALAPVEVVRILFARPRLPLSPSAVGSDAPAVRVGQRQRVAAMAEDWHTPRGLLRRELADRCVGQRRYGQGRQRRVGQDQEKDEAGRRQPDGQDVAHQDHEGKAQL